MKQHEKFAEHSAERLWQMREELLRASRPSRLGWGAAAVLAALACAMGCAKGSMGAAADAGCCAVGCAAAMGMLVALMACVEDFFVKALSRVELGVKYMGALGRALKANPEIMEEAKRRYPRGLALDLMKVSGSIETSRPCKPALVCFGGSVFC